MGLSYRKIIRNLCIGIGTVFRTVEYFKQTGNIKGNTAHNREHLRLLDSHQELMAIGFVLENPTMFIHEVITGSVAYMCQSQLCADC